MVMKAKVSTGVVSVLMMLLFLVLLPVDAGAAGQGMGMHGMGMRAFHTGGHFAPQHFGRFARHHFFRNRQAFFGVWPWYGYYPSYPYDDYSTPQVVSVPEREPPRSACQHSEQTRTVPAANGGTTEVTILRC